MAKVRKTRGKNYMGLHVDFSDIDKELKKFKLGLFKKLPEHLNKSGAPSKVAGHVKKRLTDQWSDTKSGRINAIVKAIGKGKILSRKQKSRVILGVGEIASLDKNTVISKLDAKYKQYHKAPFAKKPIEKKIGQPSKSAYSLWRILERRSGKPPIIMPSTSKYLAFTSKKNGYSRFIYAHAVTKWKLSGKYKKRRFYFLTKQRDVYKEDKKIIFTSFKSGVLAVLKKTRFREK